MLEASRQKSIYTKFQHDRGSFSTIVNAKNSEFLFVNFMVDSLRGKVFELSWGFVTYPSSIKSLWSNDIFFWCDISWFTCMTRTALAWCITWYQHFRFVLTSVEVDWVMDWMRVRKVGTPRLFMSSVEFYSGSCCIYLPTVNTRVVRLFGVLYSLINAQVHAVFPF